MHVLQTDAKEFYRSNRRCTLRVVPCFALRIVENFVIELAGSLDTGKAHELFVMKSEQNFPQFAIRNTAQA